MSAGCCEHDRGMDALMLCVALFVAAGVLVGSSRSTRVGAVLDGLRRRIGRPPGGPTARAEPPYVFAFSVIRC